MKRVFMLGLILLALAIASSGCDMLGTVLGTVRGTGDMTSETREVSGFSAVNLAGIGNLIVDYGDQGTLRIEAEENLLPYIEATVDGDTLRIGFREGVNVLPTQAIFYNLTVQELDGVQVSGLGNADVPRLEGTNVALRISGGGDIHVDRVDAQNLEVALTGLGSLTIEEGEAANSDVLLSGAGNYNAANVASQVVTVEVTGLGSANVWAEDALDATISGGGSVQYKGKPDVNESVTGVGEVRPISGE